MSAQSWTGSEVAHLSSDGRGYGGMCSLVVDGAAWQRMGEPQPQPVPVMRAAQSTAMLKMFGKPAQVDMQTLVLDVRHGSHEASIRVLRVLAYSFGVALVISSVALPEYTGVEIFGWTMVDPDPSPSPIQQLLRGDLH